MKNIQELLSISCEIFPKNDLANKWELKSIFDNFDKTKEYFDNFDFLASYTIDTLVDYFIVDKICLWDFSNNITTEYREKYEQIKKFFLNIKTKYEIKKIINFLLDYSFLERNRNKDGFIFRLYDFLPQYWKSIKDEGVYIKAINAHPYLILDRLNKYKQIFKTYKVLYKTFFSDKNIKKFLEWRFEEFARETAKLCKEDGSLDISIKEMLIDKFLTLANTIVNNRDIKKALVNQIRYKIILKFLNAVCHPKYAEYLEKQSQVDALSEQWLNENGEQLTYEIPIDGIKSQLDNPSIPWEYKYIQLTHLKKNGKWEHFCSDAMKIGKASLTELLTCSNINTNSHFGAMTQEIIRVYHDLHGFALQYFTRDLEKWKTFSNYTYSIISFVFSTFSVSVDEVTDEFIAWANSGAEYLFNKTSNSLQKKDIAFIFTDKTVKFTEKILRIIYMAEMKIQKKYFDPDKITLGTILKSGDVNNPLVEVLSIELMQYLSFCLIKDEDENGNQVGISLRNLLEHDKYNLKSFNTGNGLLSLIVFVSTLNGFFIYCSKKENC